MIDASIPLQFRKPQFATPADAMSLREMSNRVNQSEYDISPEQRDLKRQATLAQIAHLNSNTRDQGLQRDKFAHEQSVQLAKGFVSLPPDMYAIAYPELRKQAMQLSPEASQLPETWNPELLPRIQMLAGGMSAEQLKQQQEQRDYPAAPQTNQPAPQAVPLNQIAQVPENERAAGILADGDLAEKEDILAKEEIFRAKSGEQLTAPTVEVTAKPTENPDDLRDQANKWEARGGKASYERAKDLRKRADELEKTAFEQDYKERELAFKKMKEENDKANADKSREQSNKQLVTKLADDFRQEPGVKDYRTVQPLVASMENAIQQNTGTADLDMVYALAKIFDPGSVVREGEQILVVKAGGLPSQVQDWIGWVNGGQRLNTAVRKGMLDQAKSRERNYKQAYESAKNSYESQAERWGLDKQDIVREYKISPDKPLTPADLKRMEDLERKEKER